MGQPACRAGTELARRFWLNLPEACDMRQHNPPGTTAPPAPGPPLDFQAPAGFTPQPGRNCWRVEPCQRFAMLVDADAYFRALREALPRAEHTIFILGWDIDSRMELVPQARRTACGGPARLPVRAGGPAPRAAHLYPELGLRHGDGDGARVAAVGQRALAGAPAPVVPA
ncbi:hypothetical protein AU476_03940 [Cupriavidus sp. UYMSc13B]|nr:hypothetical protein AU476_03940 [Cupriavidus sp. UYMSc13B]